VYRLDDGQNFVSLANTISAFYQARTATSQIGFANLVLHAGYQLPPLSFGLTDSFVRDDNTAQLQARDTSLALLRTRQKFIRNILTPQVHYDILPTTAATFSYTNTLVVDESGTQGTTTSHAVSPGIQHQFSTNLTGHIRYTFTTSNGSGLSSGTGISGNRSHHITTDLGYQFDTETSATLSAFGTLVDRSTSTSATGGQNSRTYGTSIGVRRVLFSTVSVFGSVGPTVFKRQGEREKLRANWQLVLIFNAHFTPSLGTPPFNYDLTVQPTSAALHGWTLQLVNTPPTLSIGTNNETHLVQFAVSATAGADPTGTMVFRVKRQGAATDRTKEFSLQLLP